MAVAHRPLFGLSCPELPMPDAMDLDCAMALEGATALRAAVERTAQPVLASTSRTIEQAPTFEPENAPSAPSFRPGRG